MRKMKSRFILLAIALIGGLTICSCDGTTTFKLKTNANPKDCGTVSPTGTVKYNVGMEAKVTATPNADCAFVGWSGTSTSDEATITITMNSNQTLTANFLKLILGTFTDSRDGKEYRTVKIGDQTWMAENLNFETWNSYHYRNGKYGRLYGWEAATNACPHGWRLPSDDEWTTLVNFVGSNPGTKLKAKDDWLRGGNGTDNYGFAAFPGGSGQGGSVYDIGSHGGWWSATQTQHKDNRAWYWGINYNNSKVDRRDGSTSFDLYSVRCVQGLGDHSGSTVGSMKKNEMKKTEKPRKKQGAGGKPRGKAPLDTQ
ncbi:MAG: hypothetical protein LBU89_04205 [Fibromonadaceae bacterium]|jgi:uncharacterized protein (TIGR02145 family)/uncharacterized repeat protein (TIGR02543 family)|nr:hypothetical protein [Fibromonadaceae bacterium]